MKTLRFEETAVERCVETKGVNFFTRLYIPNLGMEAFERESRDWLDRHFINDETGRLSMSLHTCVCRDRSSHDPRRNLRRRSQVPA